MQFPEDRMDVDEDDVDIVEGDMTDVEVQAHPDGVGRHKEINVAVLIECHLRIARPGRQRAHDDGAAPPLAADQFGDGIEILDREADDGAAVSHAADLF